MANNIKGITIEINGDTTKLDKALKDVESNSKSLQNELKAVNKALKLDPNNTELVAKKQKILAEQIGATEQKLNTLKEAQKQAKEQFENGELGADKYNALQTEILETETALKSLKAQAESMKWDGVTKLGEEMEKVGGKITKAGEAILPASTAVTALGAAAVKTTADFDSSMSNVAAISGATGENLQALRDKAKEMGETTKFSASESADAMGYMAMAGWKTEDMLNGISGVMNLAAASGEDLATTSDIVTDALTAFGLSAKDSDHFADVLAATSSNANTNVSLLGETFKYCAPLCGSMGYSAEDASLAIGLMANAGIKGSQAGTTLKNAIANLVKPTDKQAAIMQRLGISLTDTQGNMLPLRAVLDQLRTSFGECDADAQAYFATTLFGKESMAGMLSIVNASESDYDKLSGAIGNCDGSAQTMADTMNDNLSGQITLLKSALEGLAISFGEILMPTIKEVVAHIQDLVDKFNALPESQKEIITKIGLAVAAAGPALIIIGKMTTGVGGLVKLIPKIATGISGATAAAGTSLTAILAPIAAVVAIIGVLVAAFKHLWDTNEAFRTAITAIWDGIKQKFEAFAQGIVQRLNALGFDFTSFTDVLKTVWDGFCDILAPVFQAAFGIVSSVLGTVLDTLTGLLDVFIGLFTGNWTQAWNGIKEIFSGVMNGITGIFQSLQPIFSNILNFIVNLFRTAWTSITLVFAPVVQFFTTTFNNAKTAVHNAFSAIGQWFSGKWTEIKNAFAFVGEFFATTFNNACTAVHNAFSAIGQWFGQRVTDIKGTFSGIESFFSTTFNNACSSVHSAFEGIGSWFQSNVIDAIKNKFEGFSLFDAGKKVVSSLIDGLKSIRLPKLSIEWGSESKEGDNGFKFNIPVPHISWNAAGGIFTGPGIAGMYGGALQGVGEAGPEAVLPLKEFYSNLEGYIGAAIREARTGSATGSSTAAGGNYVQNVNITSPKAMSPYETARQTRNATRNMILQIQKGGI